MTSATATILVTDLAGSTAQRTRLGEDRADQLRRDHDRLLTQAVATSGGEVVKGLGDGILARFGAAGEALDAAVAIQQAAAAHTRRHPEQSLAVRVGLACGDVSLEEGDCFGTPVIQAARLCAAAEPGQILATEVVRVLSSGRGGHRFHPLGALELKGLPEPVATVEVSWSSFEAKAEFPAALSAEASLPFAGRQEERQALKAAWAEVTSGANRVVLIAGEPGIGKTRLAGELARTAHAEGAVVAFGRSEENGDRPFGPFHAVLLCLASVLTETARDEHRSIFGGELARLVPTLADAMSPAHDPGDANRSRLFDAVSDLVSRVAHGAPVLLVLDDLHWADESTLSLLRHLVTVERAPGVLIVCTYRDTDIDRSHPLAGVLADLRRQSSAARVLLRGLQSSDIADLLTALAGERAPVDLEQASDALAEFTDGNAFFLGELIRHLGEERVLVTDEEGRYRVDRDRLESLGVPEGIREVVGRRLSALSEEANQVLGVAAVAGAEFDAAVVAEASGVSIEEVVDLLEAARARGLVEETTRVDRWRFAHALVRHTLLAELSLSRQARLHQRIGAAMANSSVPDVPEVAHHLSEAAAVGAALDAVAWAVRAAEQAHASLAWEQEAEWCRRALEADDEAPPDDARRADVMIHLGSAQVRLGQVAASRETFAAAAALARRAGRPDLLAQAAVGYGGPLAAWTAPDDEIGADLADEAVEALPKTDSALLVQLLIKQSSWLVWTDRQDERLRLTEAATSMARRLNDTDGMAEALREYALVCSGMPVGAELLAAADTTEVMIPPNPSADAGSFRTAVAACRSLGFVRLGRFDEALAQAEHLAAEGARRNDRFASMAACGLRAGVLIERGRLSEGLAYSDEGLTRFAGDGRAGEVVHLLQRARAAQLAGDVEGHASIRRRLAEMWIPHPGVDNLYLMLAAMLDGDVAQAGKRLDRWEQEVGPHVEVSSNLSPYYAALGAIWLGRSELSQSLLEDFEPWRGLWMGAMAAHPLMLADHLIGLLEWVGGWPERAAVSLSSARELYRHAGADPSVAMVNRDIVDLSCRSEGASGTPEALLEEAGAIDSELGVDSERARIWIGPALASSRTAG